MHVPGRLVVATALIPLLACSGGPRPERSGEGGPRTSSSRPGLPSGPLRVTLYGIGPIRAGMSVAEASSSISATLALPDGVDQTGCAYLQWPGGPDGVSIMVENLTIARVDVRSETMATEEGARVGDTVERINTLYPGRVTASPHKYTDGQYLTVAP